MIKLLSPIILLSVLMMTACGAKTSNRAVKSPSDSDNFVVDSIAYTDSVGMGDWWVTTRYNVAYLTGEAPIVKSIDKWIRYQLAINDDRPLKAAIAALSDSLIQAAAADKVDSEDGDYYNPPYGYDSKISVAYQSDKLITMEIVRLDFTGGAHGMASDVFETFSVPDGISLGWNMFDMSKSAELKKLVINAIKQQYFNLTDGEENMFFDETSFPLPATAPFVLKDGVNFIYQPYEIAPYAAGMPQCSFSYNQIASFLSTTGKSILEPR